MARKAKPRKLTPEAKAALETAASKSEAKFLKGFSAEPVDRPVAQPGPGESVAEVSVPAGGAAELRVLCANGAAAPRVEIYARRGDKKAQPWRFIREFADGPVRFTPLTIVGARRGWQKDESARVARLTVINADPSAVWSVRLKLGQA